MTLDPSPSKRLTTWLALLPLAFALMTLLGFNRPAPVAAHASLAQLQQNAPVDCPVLCKQRYETALSACLAAGGEECEAQARKVYEKCMEGCARLQPGQPADPGPMPVPPECEVACKMVADVVLKQCQNAGGADCEKHAREAFLSCTKLCSRPFSPATPKPVSCEGACRQKANDVLKACKDQGGSGDDCAAKAKAVFEECLTTCPKPTAKPPSCEEKCRAHAEEQRKLCLASGVSPDDCAAKAKALFEACVTAECKRPDTKPVQCEDGCRRRAEETNKTCLQAGGTAEDCAKQAAAVLERCLASCPKPEPKPQTCEGACKERAQAVLKACKEAGGGADECEKRYKASLEECLLTCPKPTPKPETCEGACKERAQAVLKACKEAGGGAEDCEKRYKAAFEECMTANCPRPTPKPETCEGACKERAQAVLKACKEAGGGADECEQKYKAAFEECMTANCPRPTPKPDNCEGACKERAQAVLKACKEAGGSAEDCEKRYKAAFEECIAATCPRPTPKPDQCEDKCRRVAESVLAACKEAGGNAEECGQKARTAYNECLTENCPRPTAVPTPACENRCGAAAEEARNACLREGGTEADCAAKGRRVYSDCMFRCDPQFCASVCQERSEEVRKTCLANGGNEEACAQQARKALAECKAGCPGSSLAPSPRPMP